VSGIFWMPGSSEVWPKVGSVVLKRADAKIKVWREQGKGGAENELEFDENNERVYDLSTGEGAERFYNEILTGAMWLEGCEPSAQLRDTALVLVYRDPAGTDVRICEDAVNITVVDASLTLYKRDRTTAVALDKEQDPGAYVALNNDDDDADGGGTVADKDDDDVRQDGTPKEDDTVKARCRFGSLFNDLNVGTVVLKRENPRLRLWKQAHKEGADQEIVFDQEGGTEKVYNLADGSPGGGRAAFREDILDNQDDLWVEGSQPSGLLKDTGLTLLYRDPDGADVCKDPVKVTVVDASLTLYKRDRTTAVALDKEEDPGAYVALNNDDDDADGGGTVADKDDDDVRQGGTPKEDDTVKARCAFGALFNDLNVGKVVLKRENPRLRLWKQAHKGGAGQEIVFDQEQGMEKIYNLADGLPGGGRAAFREDILDNQDDLWVEGSQASGILKDTGLALLYRDPDGADVCKDPVKVTIVEASLTVYGSDGTTAVRLDKEQDPGAYVLYNRDDDDANHAEDRDDVAVAGENDLVKATCTFNAYFSGLQKGKVILERGNDQLRLWRHQAKGAGQEIAFTSNKKTYDLSNGTQRGQFDQEILGRELWLEGYNVSGTLKGTSISLVYQDADSKAVTEDLVKATVLHLQASHVAFNRDRSAHAGDGLNIRRDGHDNTGIEAPEWHADGPDAGTDPDKGEPACFLASQSIRVWARLECSLPIASAKVRAAGSRAQPGGLSLGNLGAVAGVAESPVGVTFASGVSQGVAVPPAGGLGGFVEFTPQNPTANSVQLEDAVFEWEVKQINGDAAVPLLRLNASGQRKPHRLYTILAAPPAPWSTSNATEDKEHPWANALERVCAWAREQTSAAGAAGKVAEGIYISGYEYDNVNGDARYAMAVNKINLTLCLTEWGDPAKDINCWDTAAMFAVLGNLVGCGVQRLYADHTINPTFLLNFIRPLGRGWTNDAFTAPGRQGFACHWTGRSQVYDPCLEIDGDGSPGAPPHTGLLPKSMAIAIYLDALADPADRAGMRSGDEPAPDIE